ncbi:MAG: hypothetical protein H6563_13495 [Lewinellaceae bacterium]|nr:hypothetical protein [Lewinellaceae bacterium]
MKRIVYLILGTLLVSCFSSSKIPPKEYLKVNDIDLKISFSPESISKNVESNFEITIQPIDAKEMDGIANQAAAFDGNYEKTVSYTTFIEEELNRQDLTNHELREINHKKQILESVQLQIHSGDMPAETGGKLMEKILNEVGIDGTENDFILGTSSALNPYKVDNKYLSVFQVTSKNTGNKIQRIKLQDLLFNSGYEQLYPFNNSYFEKLYEKDQSKLRILLRLNFPDELIVPPGETVVKYISVPSLNPSTETLNIRLLQEDATVNYSYQIKFEGRSIENILEKYWFVRSETTGYSVMSYYFVLQTSDNRIFPIKDNTLFVSKEMAGSPISIYAAYTTIEGFILGKRENFYLTECPNNIVHIPFKGYKRYK